MKYIYETWTYQTFKEFYSYKRDKGVNLNDFLVHYIFLYQKLQKFSMKLSGVQAFLCWMQQTLWRKMRN